MEVDEELHILQSFKIVRCAVGTGCCFAEEVRRRARELRLHRKISSRVEIAHFFLPLRRLMEDFESSTRVRSCSSLLIVVRTASLSEHDYEMYGPEGFQAKENRSITALLQARCRPTAEGS